MHTYMQTYATKCSFEAMLFMDHRGSLFHEDLAAFEEKLARHLLGQARVFVFFPMAWCSRAWCTNPQDDLKRKGASEISMFILGLTFPMESGLSLAEWSGKFWDWLLDAESDKLSAGWVQSYQRRKCNLEGIAAIQLQAMRCLKLLQNIVW